MTLMMKTKMNPNTTVESGREVDQQKFISI